jgi:hypothetical protein
MALVISISIFGCKKFVEIPAPITQLVTSSVLTNDGTATSAVTAIYTQMFNNSESFIMSSNNGLLSDELTNYSTDQSEMQVFMNEMEAENSPGPWANAYNYIYQANALIQGLTNNTALNPAVDKQLLGEALFIRAFWNFYLTNCYGRVPLVTTTDYKVNGSIAQSTSDKIYQQIILDLWQSESLLSDNFIDASDTTVTTSRIRPTKWASLALLARVYLYLGNWTGADSASTAIINNNSLFSLDTLNGVFLANSPEAIWEIGTPLPASYNTQDGQYYILESAPLQGGVSTTLSPELLNSFEPGDNRFVDWVDSISTGGVTYYFPYKYKGNSISFMGTVTEYTVVFRLAEQFLIRAESLAQLGQISGMGPSNINALSDLDTIRTRAGLAHYSGQIDKNSILSAILHERQVELFTEWGHRWFDLIRTGNINNVMSIVTPNIKNGAWNLNDTLYPIPKSELQLDPNLTQNLGYNN